MKRRGRGRRETVVPQTDCPDELLGGPVTIQFPASFPADTQADAEQRVRSWFSDMEIADIKERLIPVNCSGIAVDPCPKYACKGGRCEFDYEIAKVTVTQVKPAGKTAKLNKPTQARWSGSLEAWWGCFCVEPD